MGMQCLWYTTCTFIHHQQLIILAMFGAMDETIAPRIGGPRLGL